MSLVAISGIPGCGKSTVAKSLREKRYTVIDINSVVKDNNFILGIDEERDSIDVDLDALGDYVIKQDGDNWIFLDSHLSQLLPVEKVLVLRCHPDILKKRMVARGWSNAKVRENLEAEAMAVITQEAQDRRLDTYEIDVTDIKVESILNIIFDILENGKGEQYRPGAIDHFEEILKWY